MSVPTHLTGKCPHCGMAIVLGSGQQPCSWCGVKLPDMKTVIKEGWPPMSKKAGSAPIAESAPQVAKTYSPDLLKPRESEPGVSITPCYDCGDATETAVPGGWRGIYICTDRRACRERVEAQRCKHPGCVGGIISPRESYHVVDAIDGTVNPELVSGEMCPQCKGWGKAR